MTEQEERQQAFQAFKEEVLKEIKDSGARVDEETLESVELARTYTQLSASITHVLLFLGGGLRYKLLRTHIREFSHKAEVIVRDAEAEWLGVDLTVV